MSWLFRKRISVIPGVTINLSQSGISTTIGIPGLSVNIGGKGTFLNTGIPGTGIYRRDKLSSKQPNYLPSSEQEPPPDNIYSADPQHITNQNVQGIKDAILVAIEEEVELYRTISAIKRDMRWSKFKLYLSYVFLYGVFPSVREPILQDIANQEEAIWDTEIAISQCQVDIDIQMDEFVEDKYRLVERAFRQLIRCDKIWDITGEYFQDAAQLRTQAGTVLRRHLVTFEFDSVPYIKSTYKALRINNYNGANLYLYPGFLVVYSISNGSYGIIGLDDLRFSYREVLFTEREILTSDAQKIGITWNKVNKDGSRDLRFKDNYSIPVVKYGSLMFRSDTGLNEEYMFSHFMLAEDFAKKFLSYQFALKNINYK